MPLLLNIHQSLMNFRMLRFAMLDPSTQALPDRYRLISDLTLTQLTDFLSKFKSQLFIEGFVIGNFQPEVL